MLGLQALPVVSLAQGQVISTWEAGGSLVG
jgi:hypothetical protein